MEHPGTGRRRSDHSPKRDHGRTTSVSPMMQPQTPRATLKDELISISDGTASVPGCPISLAGIIRKSTREPRVSDVVRRDCIAWAAKGGHYVRTSLSRSVRL